MSQSMRMITVVIVSNLFVFSCLSFAKEKKTNSVAEVLIVKGKATKLLPKMREASEVKVGDRLLEDTSVVTDKGSFVRIKYIDASQMNVGPESKIVVQQITKKEGGVVSLLVGQVRTHVVKRPNSKQDDPKFFINTRTAAMGVRGTEFQTVYNPLNKSTSLVTFDGQVAMAKTEVPIETKAKDIAEIKKTDLKELKELMKASDVVEVPPGRFAGVSESVAKPSVPVKISPTQFEILANKPEEKITEKKIDKEVINQFADQAPPEGVTDTATGKIAPRAGGFIDVNTGIYVAPSSADKFDAVNNVFIPNKDVGKISTKGEYLPPKGLKLAPTGVFEIDENKAPEVDPTKLLAMQANLNKENIAVFQQAKEEPNKIEKIIPPPAPQAPSRFKAHHLAVGMYPVAQTMSYTNEGKDIVGVTKTAGAFDLPLIWTQDWKNDKWSSYLGLTLKKRNFSNQTQVYVKDDEKSTIQIEEENDTNIAPEFGFIYHYKHSVDIAVSWLIDQKVYAITYQQENQDLFSDYSRPHLKMFATPKMNLDISKRLYDKASFLLYAAIGASAIAPDKHESEKMYEGAELRFWLKGSYSTSDNSSWEPKLWYRTESQTVKSYGSKKYTSHQEYGLGLSYVRHYF